MNNKSEEHGKPVLNLLINCKNFEWHEEYITGSEIRKLGNIPAEDEIFLAIKKPWEDEPIPDVCSPGVLPGRVFEQLLSTGRPRDFNQLSHLYVSAFHIFPFPSHKKKRWNVRTW